MELNFLNFLCNEKGKENKQTNKQNEVLKSILSFNPHDALS